MNKDMFLLQATDEQIQKILKFLDSVLKKEGIEVLQDVVDVYNVVVSAQKMKPLENNPLQETSDVPKVDVTNGQ